MRTLVLLIPTALLMFSVLNLQAETIHVPSQQPTIQAGIDAAVDGDTVLVADGIYTGDGNRDIEFLGKAIVVISQNGPEVTIIDCEASEQDQHRGLYFHQSETNTTTVQGFTLMNALRIEGGDYGSGIYCSNSDPTIRNMVVTNCTGGYGAGINCRHADPYISNCLIKDNNGSHGGGIKLDYSNATLINCTVTGNNASGWGGGFDQYSSNTVIVNTIFWGNTAPSWPEIRVQSGTLNISYCDVAGGWPGEGNIDEDPMFVQPDTSQHTDHRFLWGSPCIDTGDPGLLDPDGTRSDMGAHYFNQDDFLTLYVTPDKRWARRGEEVGVTYTAINRWAVAEQFWIITQVIQPDGTIKDVIGPGNYTLPAKYTFQYRVIHTVPQWFPYGVSEYRSLIGMPPGTLYDKDSFKFKIVE